jgi:hypothetical protein
MDIYDGADWTEMDIDDLKAAIEGGATIEQAAQFLCRADSVDDVARTPTCFEMVTESERAWCYCSATVAADRIFDARSEPGDPARP